VHMYTSWIQSPGLVGMRGRQSVCGRETHLWHARTASLYLLTHRRSIDSTRQRPLASLAESLLCVSIATEVEVEIENKTE